MIKKLLLSILFLIATLNIAITQVVINEYSASNLKSFTDSFGKTEDWIELYNTTNTTIDISGWYLSDKASSPTKWKIPEGTNIPANNFLVFLCSGRDVVVNGEYHTNFKLTQTKGADVVLLADPSGVVKEQLDLNLTLVEHSNCRVTDGSDEWRISTDPSFGTSNNSTPQIKGYTLVPSMSVAAGYYEDSQMVSIQNNEPNSILRYTTDGNNPTIESPMYTMPISVNKTTVIKAQAFSNDPLILPGKMEFNTYFINEDFSLPVFSVAADRVTNLANGFGELLPIGSIEYFDKNKERTATSFGSLNRHGQDSWILDHRSLDWISRDEMGYSKAVEAPIFSSSDRSEYQKFMFRNSGDDNYPAIDDEEHEGSTHVRDEYVQTLSQKGDLKLDVRTVERVVLFLNGTYWGVYGMREKVVDHDYTETYYNQGKYEIQYLSTWAETDVEYGGKQALLDWENLRDFILENDMSQPENYTIAEDSLNMLSIIDYFLINQATVASDWLNYNTGWWRGLNPEGGHKKWGYILWDLDATFDYYINYTGIPNEEADASLCDIFPISEEIDFFFQDTGGFPEVNCADFGGNNSPYASTDSIFQLVINYDPFCCSDWNEDCQALYDDPSAFNQEEIGNPEACLSVLSGSSPYAGTDSIFIQVVNIDGFCCGEWDGLCQDLYDDISNSGTIFGGNFEDCPIFVDSTSPYPVTDPILSTILLFESDCCEVWGEDCQFLYNELSGESGVDVSGCTIFVEGTSPYSIEDPKVAQVISMNPDCCEIWGVSCQNDYDIIGPGQFEGEEDTTGTQNIFYNVGQHEKLFIKLFEENPTFKQLFYSRYADLMNTVFSCEHMNNLLEEMVEVIEPEMPKQIARWGGTMEEWQVNLDNLRLFINDRCTFLNQEALACHGDLSGQYDLTLMTQPAEVGTIDFNTLDIEEFPWQGTYFGGMSNIIKAKVAKSFEEEYEFSHWESKAGNKISPSIMDRSAKIDLASTDTLIAVYQLLSSIDQEALVINEFMAANDATVADQDEEFDDWIELFNNTDQAIDLTGYFLTDNAQNLSKYDIPEGTIIPAEGYLIIWADEDGMQEGLHANFKLSRDGESIFLVNPDTVIIDEISFDMQAADIAFARIPNGVGDFVFRTPTFNENNDNSLTDTEDLTISDSQLLVYPNPTNHQLTVQLTNYTENNLQIQVYDVFGRLVLHKEDAVNKMVLNVNTLLDGFYLVVVNQVYIEKVVIKR